MTELLRAIHFTSDALNRLDTLTDRTGALFDFDYDRLSRRTLLTLPNGTEVVAGYDPASQLESLITRLTANPTTHLTQTVYTYDPRGNRLTRTDRLGQHTYGDDALSRLTAATHPAASALVPEFFRYDPVGNRTTSHLSATHRHDGGNRLLEDATFAYGYDANGNRTTRTRKAPPSTVETFTYDGEDQLIGYTMPQAPTTGGPITATYRYDGLGRRIEKQVNGALTRFLYDQEDIVGIFAGEANCQTHF